MLRKIVFPLLAALLCVARVEAPARAQTEAPLVFAAASLKTALDAVVAEYRDRAGREVRISYAGTPALARQIEQGAPADIFISADLDWMLYLSERSLIRAGSQTPLLSNRLVLIAPADSAVAATIGPELDLSGILADGRLALANTDAVPAGRYAKAALQKLGLWESLRDQLAETENVRAALALVARGEAPLGIVYATDAAAEPQVKVVDRFPENLHPTIVYPAALTPKAKPEAEAFFAFLTSPAARPFFVRAGFSVLVPAS